MDSQRLKGLNYASFTSSLVSHLEDEPTAPSPSAAPQEESEQSGLVSEVSDNKNNKSSDLKKFLLILDIVGAFVRTGRIAQT